MHSLRDTNPAAFARYLRAKNAEPCAAARLTAAAPELLDALQRVLRHIPADAGGASLSDDIHRARRAIARATGDA